ncbi:MAG: hypothetical protein J6O41_01200 [Clostridia bacterium]|nr:hypothetical protein [Clostridia bacterium]
MDEENNNNNTEIDKEINQKTNIKKSFFKDKKNIAILVLSIILFIMCIPSNSTSSYIKQIEDLKLQISDLTKTNEELSSKLQISKDNENKIKTLQNENKLLQEDKDKLNAEKQQLENEKTQLENEKNELNSKIEELQRTSSTKNSSSTISSSPSVHSTSSKQSTSNSYTVYVTNTGKKYHTAGCSYLKNSKIAIDKNQAINQGYSPCSRCNP